VTEEEAINAEDMTLELDPESRKEVHAQGNPCRENRDSTIRTVCKHVVHLGNAWNVGCQVR
jgi:hypothetical protein